MTNVDQLVLQRKAMARVVSLVFGPVKLTGSDRSTGQIGNLEATPPRLPVRQRHFVTLRTHTSRSHFTQRNKLQSAAGGKRKLQKISRLTIIGTSV